MQASRSETSWTKRQDSAFKSSPASTATSSTASSVTWRTISVPIWPSKCTNAPSATRASSGRETATDTNGKRCACPNQPNKGTYPRRRQGRATKLQNPRLKYPRSEWTVRFANEAIFLTVEKIRGGALSQVAVVVWAHSTVLHASFCRTNATRMILCKTQASKVLRMHAHEGLNPCDTGYWKLLGRAQRRRIDQMFWKPHCERRPIST